MNTGHLKRTYLSLSKDKVYSLFELHLLFFAKSMRNCVKQICGGVQS